MARITLPVWNEPAPVGDWLLGTRESKAALYQNEKGDQLVLANGLVSRTFSLKPGFASISMKSLTSGNELLRCPAPEGLVLIGRILVSMGGLVGQQDRAFFDPQALSKMSPPEDSMKFDGYEVAPMTTPIEWRKTNRAVPTNWPPSGVHLRLHFSYPGSDFSSIKVIVHYELCDNLPCFTKWLEIVNEGPRDATILGFKLEQLSVVEENSSVEDANVDVPQSLQVFSNYAFGGVASRTVMHWLDEPEYGTQVNYQLKTKCRLEVAPPIGPYHSIPAGTEFETFRSHLVIHDSSDRERRSLTVRKTYRTLAPWIRENPIMLHLTSTDPAVVHRAVDQAAECGFEMVILSFGSGVNMEDDGPQNIAKYKAFADYAHSKGIQLGGYSLLASRRIDDANDVINPTTGKPGGAIFGNSPCLCSQWGIDYFRKLKHFMEATGFDLLEHDGNYPGDICASTSHPGHRNQFDSQYNQWKMISDFYAWCRSRGIYLNVPDEYHFAGSNKTGMGYRETNWSLPRAQQHLHARQNMFDGTWSKTPSMGWMFTPLVEYQGGGAAATIEPLKDHLADYRQHLINNFSYGVQSCYRGPRVYDSPETKAMVIEQVSWFKKYREILESDVIHVRRSDGRNLDAVLHVNPTLAERGLLAVFNPTDHELLQSIRIPLYYAGLSKSVRLAERDGTSKVMALDADGSFLLSARIPAGGWTWYVIRKR